MSAVCEECGVPKLITRSHSWHDGCIVDRASGNANFCVYEVDFHNALFKKVGAELGMPLDNIILNAGRRASAQVIDDLLSAFPLLAKIAFTRPLYRLTQKILVDFGVCIGSGKIELIEHKKGKRGTIRVTDPYNVPHCTAILLGSMDYMYGYPVAFTVREEGDDVIIAELLLAKGDSAVNEAFLRLASEDLKPEKSPTTHAFKTCEKCGAPREFGSAYSFDLSNGMIIEQLNRERVVMLGVYSINSIVREFENELGQDITNLFARMEEESFKRKLAVTLVADEMRNERDIRDYLCLRGLGMLSEMKEEGDTTYFTLENAFIPPVVVGRLLALCEYNHGEKCTYEYTLEDNTMRLSVAPEKTSR